MNTHPDSKPHGYSAMFGMAGLMALLLLCSCSKNLEPTATNRAPGKQDPELALENQIQGLLGELNKRKQDVDVLIRGAGPNLTPETRNKARAARYEFYPADKYVEAMHAGETAAKSKLATLTGHAVTNTPSIRPIPGAAPDETAAENGLKAVLMEVRTVSEELAMNDKANADSDNQPQTNVEPYVPEDYENALKLVVMLMERKAEGYRAEAAFYRNLLGLDEDNVPVQKK